MSQQIKDRSQCGRRVLPIRNRERPRIKATPSRSLHLVIPSQASFKRTMPLSTCGVRTPLATGEKRNYTAMEVMHSTNPVPHASFMRYLKLFTFRVNFKLLIQFRWYHRCMPPEILSMMLLLRHSECRADERN